MAKRGSAEVSHRDFRGKMGQAEACQEGEGTHARGEGTSIKSGNGLVRRFKGH